jgi:hypothetical protein
VPLSLGEDEIRQGKVGGYEGTGSKLLVSKHVLWKSSMCNSQPFFLLRPDNPIFVSRQKIGMHKKERIVVVQKYAAIVALARSWLWGSYN